jgi:agmatinase
VALIHFDAHMDTWQDNYNGIPFGHGNPFFHAINEKLINPNKMIQIGIRSPIQKNIFDWTKQKGVHIWTAEDVHETNVKIIIDYIKKELQDLPVYLTIDIDVLDPAYAPGTGTPEIGGLHSWQVQKILRYLTELNFVGMDIVEVSPPYDVNEITSLAAATFVWEYLALLKINETIKK